MQLKGCFYAPHTEAEFQQALDNWKATMTPQLIQAAKDMAANILDTYADAVVKAEVTASSPEAKEEVAAVLVQAAQMARDMAAQLRDHSE